MERNQENKENSPKKTISCQFLIDQLLRDEGYQIIYLIKLQKKEQNLYNNLLKNLQENGLEIIEIKDQNEYSKQLNIPITEIALMIYVKKHQDSDKDHSKGFSKGKK